MWGIRPSQVRALCQAEAPLLADKIITHVERKISNETNFFDENFFHEFEWLQRMKPSFYCKCDCWALFDKTTRHRLEFFTWNGIVLLFFFLHGYECRLDNKLKFDDMHFLCSKITSLCFLIESFKPNRIRNHNRHWTEDTQNFGSRKNQDEVFQTFSSKINFKVTSNSFQSWIQTGGLTK